MPRFRSIPSARLADLRRQPGNATVEVVTEAPAPVVEEPEVDYRSLQARAKELDIPANQSRDDLTAAIAKAESDD